MTVGVAAPVLPVILFLLIAWPHDYFEMEVGGDVMLTSGAFIAVVFALAIGFFGESLLGDAIKAAMMSPGLLLPIYHPWLGIGGIAVFSGALSVMLLRLLRQR